MPIVSDAVFTMPNEERSHGLVRNEQSGLRRVELLVDRGSRKETHNSENKKFKKECLGKRSKPLET
jgi:hypothetical protein